MGRGSSCGSDTLRGVLLVLNVLFVLVGLALIGIGIYIKVDSNFAAILSKLTSDNNLEGQSFGYLAFVMIGGGVFTVLIALFGCMGALWHNRCFLYMYAIILTILMIIELAGLIMAFIYKSNLQQVYETTLFKGLTTALEKKEAKALKAIEELENVMKCCGVHNASDYNGYNHTLIGYCAENPTAQGCGAAIVTFLNGKLPIIGGLLGGVLGLELFGLIAAIALAKVPSDDSDEASSKKSRMLTPSRYR